ncbi:MFS transporter, partial [Pantoea sp. SIMBA_072]
LQVSLGYSAFEAGLMMLPVAAAGMFSKRIITQLITRHGYRKVLLVNTIMVGVMMASFALMRDTVPVWVKVVHLALFGGFNSMQFTAMNTVTLIDLDDASASSGNSLLSVVAQLA